MATVIDGSASVTINNGAVLGITSGTVVASTSGTSIDFTGIPSWIKRLTVMFNGVSTNGSSNPLIQIGAGSVTTTGYETVTSRVRAGVAEVYRSTVGFNYGADNSSMVLTGNSTITNITGNTWIFSGVVSQVTVAGTPLSMQGGGSLVLGGTLDRIRVTTTNGTDTFDAGSINIMYEG